ncbi:hypothetical protein H0N98_01585 [Candidatus Micrarchaeota archaeon]|nr:hypothetical protein [Candidatus Micrarchaeota archaeon]
MRIIGGWLNFLLDVFLFAAFLAGVFIQLNRDFYLGTGIVLITLGIEFAKEVSRTEKKRKMRWRNVIGLGFGTLTSMAGLFLSLLLALVLKDKAFYILLLDSSFSTMVFLSSSFLRFWKYLKR